MDKFRTRGQLVALIALALILYLLFIGIYSWYTHKNKREEVSRLAGVIASSLWSLDPRGMGEFLAYTTDINDYQPLTVIENNGKVFIRVESEITGIVKPWLIRWGLVSPVELTAPVMYEQMNIGRISALWYPDSFLVFAGSLLTFLLAMVSIWFFKKTTDARRELQNQHELLEKLVEERTRALETANRHLNHMHRIARSAEQAETIQDYYRIIHESIAAMMSADNFFIGLLDKCANTVRFPYFVDEKDAIFEITNASESGSLTAEVVSTCRPLLLNEGDLIARYADSERRPWGSIAKNWLGVPLLVSGEVIGIIGVQSYRETGLYGEEEREILESASHQIALAIVRKQAGEALKERDMHFTSLLTNPVGYLIYRLKAGPDPISPIVTHVSTSIVDILGISSEEMATFASWFTNMHPDDLLRVIDANERGCRPPFLFDEEFRFHHPKKGWIWLHGRSVGIPYADNPEKIEWANGIIIDITVRKQAEEALRQSEEKFALAFRTAPYAITITRSDDGGFIDVNEAFTTISGFTKEEALADSSVGMQLWADTRDRERVIKDIFAEGKVLGREMRFRGKSGNTIIGLFSSQVIHLNGEACLLSSINDITDRKRAEEERERLQAQLQQAQKMEAVGTLAGGVAHDFNNLLQAINGYTQLLLMERAESDSDYEKLRAIHKAVSRAADLVRQLLLFSRKANTQRKPLDLNREIEHVRWILERTIPKMIRIEVHMGSRLWKVEADPVQIEQILLNLGSNAADAMPEGGELVIRTENICLDDEYTRNHIGVAEGRYVLLTITDSGHGMDPDTVGKIFEPFFTTKEIGKGTGLGLASVYGIVKNHGGNILCYSEVGKGTTFRIYLPATDAVAVQDSAALPKAPPRGNGEMILLVDDEEPIRGFARQALGAFGYSVLTASSGEEALEMYSRGEPRVDLTVMDVGMPGMGGRRCLEEMMRLDPAAKVIIASGYALDGETRRTLEAGALAYIGKPYQLNEMLIRIRNVLDGYPSDAEPAVTDPV